MTNQTSGESRAYSGIAVLVLFGLAIASNHADSRLATGGTVRPAFDDPVDFAAATIVREAVLRLPAISIPEVIVIQSKDSEQCL